MKKYILFCLYLMNVVGITAQTANNSEAIVTDINSVFTLETHEFLPFVVDFSPAQSTIGTVGQASLKDVATFMQRNEGIDIMVIGFAKPGNNEKVCQKLSESRVKAVKQALVSRYKIDGRRITLAALGADKGLASIFCKSGDAVMFVERNGSILYGHRHNMQQEASKQADAIIGAIAGVLFSDAGTGRTSCQYCHGSGYVNGETCPKCRGSQFVYDEEKATKEQAQIAKNLQAKVNATSNKTVPEKPTNIDNYDTKRSGNFYYEGKVLNGKPHGRGIQVFCDASNYWGESISGEWKDGQISTKCISRKFSGYYFGFPNQQDMSGYGGIIYSLTNKKNDIYVGDFVKGEPHGKGTYYSSKGDVYVGEFAKGKRSGMGVLKSSDGSVYKGAFKNGQKTGYSTITYPNGNVDKGQFENDHLLFGIRSLPDGTIYQSGVFDQYGLIKGKINNSDGTIFIGFRNAQKDKNQGYGQFIEKDKRYDGNYENGYRSGHGIMTWNNGDEYDGKWALDKMIKGTLTYANGNIYQGEFKNDLQGGNGVMYYADSHTYVRGQWKDGKVVIKEDEGAYINDTLIGFFKVYVDEKGNKWKGYFKDSTLNSTLNGEAKYYGVNGITYVGRYYNGSMSGRGVMTYPDGSKYEGRYKWGNRHGVGIFFNAKTHTYILGNWGSGQITEVFEEGKWDGDYHITEVTIDEKKSYKRR